jgi:hypothetical protein
MQDSLFQKLWLGAILLLFAGTVGYGGWMLGIEQEASVGWKEYSESDFLTEIPSDWEGCYIYGAMLYVEYAISKEEMSCGSDYDSDSMLEAIFISISSGRTIGGSEGASFASAQEEAEEGVEEKRTIMVSGREATLYLYEDDSARVLVESDPYLGHVNFYTISTYDYDDQDIRGAFDHVIETFEIQEN